MSFFGVIKFLKLEQHVSLDDTTSIDSSNKETFSMLAQIKNVPVLEPFRQVNLASAG